MSEIYLKAKQLFSGRNSRLIDPFIHHVSLSGSLGLRAERTGGLLSGGYLRTCVCWLRAPSQPYGLMKAPVAFIKFQENPTTHLLLREKAGAAQSRISVPESEKSFHGFCVARRGFYLWEDSFNKRPGLREWINEKRISVQLDISFEDTKILFSLKERRSAAFLSLIYGRFSSQLTNSTLIKRPSNLRALDFYINISQTNYFRVARIFIAAAPEKSLNACRRYYSHIN